MKSLVTEIKRRWNPSSRAGCLVRRFQGIWHYGIALSETRAISWNTNNQLNIHDLDSFADVAKVRRLRERQIFANLIASVYAFHSSDWFYSLSEWNCEHWARLVVSGEAISGQVAVTVVGIPFHARNHDAEQKLAYWVDRRGFSAAQKLYH